MEESPPPPNVSMDVLLHNPTLPQPCTDGQSAQLGLWIYSNDQSEVVVEMKAVLWINSSPVAFFYLVCSESQSSNTSSGKRALGYMWMRAGQFSSALRWWCHAEKSRRRWHWWRGALAEELNGTLDAGIPTERCGDWAEDDEQRGASWGRTPVSRRCRCGGSGEEAGRPAQPAGEAADLQRAERPQERTIPAFPELSVQRVGETEGMGFRLPRFCVST